MLPPTLIIHWPSSQFSAWRISFLLEAVIVTAIKAASISAGMHLSLIFAGDSSKISLTNQINSWSVLNIFPLERSSCFTRGIWKFSRWWPKNYSVKISLLFLIKWFLFSSQVGRCDIILVLRLPRFHIIFIYS